MYADSLLPNAVWVTCPYYRRDGESNPDTHTDTANNRGAFVIMSDAVLYNALTWAINGSSNDASNAASWINTRFIAKDTYMIPDLNCLVDRTKSYIKWLKSRLRWLRLLRLK